jgi:hypothetical protein
MTPVNVGDFIVWHEGCGLIPGCGVVQAVDEGQWNEWEHPPITVKVHTGGRAWSGQEQRLHPFDCVVPCDSMDEMRRLWAQMVSA